MFSNEMDRVLGSYQNSIEMLDKAEPGYIFKKTIIEDAMAVIFNEQIIAERRQLGHNRVAFEKGLKKAEEDLKRRR